MSDEPESDLPLRTKTRSWKSISVNFLLVSLILGGIAALLLPDVSRNRPQVLRGQCKNSLRQIGIALRAYHDRYQCFPPAYLADESGRPMHSWRVLILPYLDQGQRYDRYRFDEPWDGPTNSELAAQFPPWLYHCPVDPSDRSVTSYVAVIGPHSAWPGQEPTTLGDFPDGISTTLHVVEVANSGIHWMAPRDLNIGQMAATINPKSGQGISSAHGPADGPPGGQLRGPGANVVFADGELKYLPEAETTKERLRALLTRNGGEHVDER